MEGKPFLIPVLSKPAVGIDTSGLESSLVIAICCLDNFGAGAVFLGKHLSLPKAKNPIEFKWNKLNQHYKMKVLKNLNVLLNISSCGLLIINTNVLISPVIPLISAFINLIEGCFSGYENMPSQPKTTREKFRHKFFMMCNNTPIHCNSDFKPLTPDKMVRSLVMTLSKKNGKIQKFTPLYAPLKSEESIPIQIADMTAGTMGRKIRENEKPPFPTSHLFYDGRKINKKSRKRGKFAKAYYWFRSE